MESPNELSAGAILPAADDNVNAIFSSNVFDGFIISIFRLALSVPLRYGGGIKSPSQFAPSSCGSLASRVRRHNA
jgi:hypothetical protein